MAQLKTNSSNSKSKLMSHLQMNTSSRKSFPTRRLSPTPTSHISLVSRANCMNSLTWLQLCWSLPSLQSTRKRDVIWQDYLSKSNVWSRQWKNFLFRHWLWLLSPSLLSSHFIEWTSWPTSFKWCLLQTAAFWSLATRCLVATDISRKLNSKLLSGENMKRT